MGDQYDVIREVVVGGETLTMVTITKDINKKHCFDEPEAAGGNFSHNKTYTSRKQPSETIMM